MYNTYKKSIIPVLVTREPYRFIYIDIASRRFVWLWQIGRFQKTVSMLTMKTP